MNMRQLAYAALFAALTAVGAWITIPLPLVPITLQLMVTLLAGLLLGSRTGALSQIVYILMGVAGLPVFSARQAGFGVLIGPTGGYIIGFVLAAWVVGKIIEVTNKYQTSKAGYYVAHGIALLTGIIAIYVPGTAILTWHVGSLKTALSVGVVSFIPADILKAIAALLVGHGLKKRGVVPRLDG